jgi:6-phosphogluconate dehydrogenase
LTEEIVFYKDSVRRAEQLHAQGIHFIDCGTSGGMEGARNGACLMLGGETEHIESLSWVWNAAATNKGWAYFGPAGAGHFVKMVHNGVEYGMNQAIGEGFEILAKSPYNFNLHAIAENWTHGSVVRGWLMELLSRAFSKDNLLKEYTGKVGGGETGAWTVTAGQELNVSTPVLQDALEARKNSQTQPTFAGKVVSALRFEYGGHKE